METPRTVDGILAHYGVKGMKWGVRRSAAERAAPSEVKVRTKSAQRGSQDIKVTNKHGGRVATKGGKRNVATDEAIRSAVARQKAKKSTTNALSNKELKDAVDRMNLEQQFNKLTKQDAKANRGKKFISAVFKVGTGDLVGAAAAASSTSTRATQVRPRRAIGS